MAVSIFSFQIIIIILCLFDDSDIDDVKPMKFTAQVKKLGDYHPDGSTIIIDPYYVSYNCHP